MNIAALAIARASHGVHIVHFRRQEHPELRRVTYAMARASRNVTIAALAMARASARMKVVASAIARASLDVNIVTFAIARVFRDVHVAHLRRQQHADV